MKANHAIGSSVLSLAILLNYVPLLSACTIFNATEGDWTLAAGNEDSTWGDVFIRFAEPSADHYGTVTFFNRNDPKVGMNDQGLFYDRNSLPETGWSADPNKQDYAGSLQFKILRECVTVDEVIAVYALYNEPLFHRLQIHWADATGASVVVGYDPNTGQDGYLAKTGHFQVSTNFNVLTSTGPEQRYDTAADLLANNRNISISLMSHVCSEVHQPSWTLFSHIFDTATRKLYVHCHYPTIDFNDVALLNVGEEAAKGDRDVLLTSLAYAPKNEVFPPAVTTFDPPNNATAARLNGTLSLTFTETVHAGAGSITIRQYSDDTTFEIININDVGGLGTNTITIDPVQWFSTDTQYYVLIDDTALMDDQGDFYYGIPAKASWNFTTAARGPEGDPPVISSIVAMGNPEEVKITSDEPVLKGPAEVPTNYKISDGVTVHSAVVGLDSQTVTLATSTLWEGVYTLTVNNIEDYWNNVVGADTEQTFAYTEVLQAHWRLDEAEGTKAHDSIGANHGTLFGDPIWQPNGGVIDGAMAFDGAGDYIDTPFVLSEGAPFGIFAWVKGGSGGEAIIDNWLRADHGAGNLLTRLGNKGLYSETPIIDGQWHRVGVAADPGTGTRVLYVDDIEVARDSQEEGIWAFEMGLTTTIGAIQSSSRARYFWSGMIDDVRIYDYRGSEG